MRSINRNQDFSAILLDNLDETGYIRAVFKAQCWLEIGQRYISIELVNLEARRALQRQVDRCDNMGRSLELSDVDLDGMFDKSLLPGTIMIIPLNLEDVSRCFVGWAIYRHIRVRIAMVDSNKVQMLITTRLFLSKHWRECRVQTEDRFYMNNLDSLCESQFNDLVSRWLCWELIGCDF